MSKSKASSSGWLGLATLFRRASSVLRESRKDRSFRERLVHVTHLMGGNYSVAVLSILAIAISARTLSPVEYGMLALTISFTRAVERFVSFQSWQPLIRFGAAIDKEALKPLLKFGLVLDLATALAAWMVAIGCAVLASSAFGWEEQTRQLVTVYATVLLFNILGLPTAVLRLAGRFRAMSYGQLGGAVLRVLLCSGAALANADLLIFGLIWMATQVVSSMTLLIIALLQLRKDGVHGWLRAPVRGISARFPGIWSFAFSTNLSLTLRSSAQQLDVLLVGALAGPASAGLYHIAKQVARLAQQLGAQVQAVVYPDVVRLWAEGAVARFRKAVLQVELLLAAFGIAAVVATGLLAEPLLSLAVGPEFAGAGPLMLVQMIAVLLSLSGAGAYSALMAMGLEKRALAVVSLGTATFFLTAFLLIPRIGPMGANIGHVLSGLIWLLGLTVIYRRALARTGSGSIAAKPAAESLQQAPSSG